MCHTLHLLAICFAPSIANSFIFLTLTRLVVVFIFVNFSFALFTPPLGDYQPDMSGVHRTVRCDNEPTDTSVSMATCSALNARQRAQGSGTPMLAHRTSRRTQKSELQRSEPNGFGDVAVAPDMSGVHRTVRCAIEQTASTNGQVWWLGL